MEITTRESVKGKEYIFRWNGKIIVSKSRKEAEIKYAELSKQALF